MTIVIFTLHIDLGLEQSLSIFVHLVEHSSRELYWLQTAVLCFLFDRDYDLAIFAPLTLVLCQLLLKKHILNGRKLIRLLILLLHLG